MGRRKKWNSACTLTAASRSRVNPTTLYYDLIFLDAKDGTHGDGGENSITKNCIGFPLHTDDKDTALRSSNLFTSSSSTI